MAERESMSKALGQRERILTLLCKRGRAGATNSELNLIGFRYGARIWELRHQGYQICTLREDDQVFRFVLDGEPTGTQPEVASSKTFDEGPDAEPEKNVPAQMSEPGPEPRQQELFLA